MSNTINMNIAASDNGSLDNVTNKAKALNKELKSAQTTASSLGKGAASTVAYQKAKAMSDDSFEYRQARGARGTGAEGRDFAKQAQGLGGLVHVYATFAANLFAVSAAFTALSKAADYENMVKGLDQLGAASGRNLGTMAKNVMDLTDNAITLKEAMATVTQATSAGMSTAQIDKLTLGAKKASQALGRDMSDSINRLTRGITKIEPELLDELGIFVRVDKAAQDYARTLGKTATSLTEYERRQAFAIASLAQLEEKFGAINIDANPYNKLLASFTNLLVTGGTLINTVLGPIAKLLSESPTALTIVMGGIASMLLKQAIPALTQWKSRLVEVAEADAKLAKQLAVSQQEYNINKQLGTLDSTLAPLKKQQAAAIENLQESLKAALPATSKMLKTALSEGFLPSDQDIKNYTGALTKAENRLKASSDLINSKSLTESEVALQKEKHAILEKQVTQLSLAKKEAESIRDVTKQQRDIELSSLDSMEKARWISEERARERIAEKAEKKSIKSTALRDFQVNAQQLGTFAAFEKLDQDLQKAGGRLGEFDKAVVKTKAGIVGAVSMAGTFLNSISNVFMAVGVGAVVFQLLDSLLSKNAKQMEEFNKQIDFTESSVTTLNNTMEHYKNNGLSVAGIDAYATALLELSDSIDSLTKKYKKLEEATATSQWDRMKNEISRLWSGDMETTFAKGLTDSLLASINSLKGSAEYNAAISKLQSATGADDKTDRSSLIERIAKAVREGNFSKIQEVSEYLANVSKETNKAAKALKAFEDSSNNAVKAAQNLKNSFLPNDLASRFGIEMLSTAKNLQESFYDTRTAVSALADALENADKFSMFSAADQKNMMEYRDQILDTKKALSDLDSQIAEARKQRQDLLNQGTVSQLGATIVDDTTGSTYTGSEKVKATDSKAYKNLEQQIPILEAQREKTLAEINAVTVKFEGSALSIFDKGSQLISRGIKLELEKSALEYGKTVAGLIKGPGSTEIQTKLQMQEISIQQKLIESNMELVVNSERLRIAIEADKISREFLAKPTEALYKQGVANEKERALFYKTNSDGTESAKSAKEVYKGIKSGSGMENANFSSIGLVLEGFMAQIDALGNKAKAIDISGKAKKEQDEADQKNKTLDAQNKLNAAELVSLNNATSVSGVYNEVLESRKIAVEKSIADNEEQKLSNNLIALKAVNQIALNAAQEQWGKDSEKYNKLNDDALTAQKASEKELAALKATNQAKLSQLRLAAVEKEFAALQKVLELEQKLYDMQLSLVDKKIEARPNSKTGLMDQKTSIELLKLRKSANLEIAKNEKSMQGASEEEKAQYAVKISQLKETLLLDEAKIKLENEYQKALVQTEETLRSMESAGQFTSDYFTAMQQDFSNKINELVNASKSAADAFNAGFIQAVDSSIDEFFSMLQKSELTMKDMVTFARNALSDVFKDTASQLVKNAWKDLAKGLLPKSDQDKALDKYELSTNNLIAALDKNTSALTGGTPKAVEQAKNTPTTPNDVTSASDTLKGDEADTINRALEESVAREEKNNTTLSGTLTTFGSDMIKVASGQMSAMDMFQRLIGSLSGVFSQFIQGLFASQQSSGGGDSGGILGSLIKAGIGFFTGGPAGAISSIASDTLMGMSNGPMTSSSQISANAMDVNSAGMGGFAKGGVFGHESLSAYSNSVVSSPTTFAFAKGSPSTGLMGEAGPEAIIPLKRDAQGNLGIRGGSSGDNNNISINITVENGQVSENGTSGSSKDNAVALGNVIKAVVSQELIKQTRPGGLLAR